MGEGSVNGQVLLTTEVMLHVVVALGLVKFTWLPAGAFQSLQTPTVYTAALGAFFAAFGALRLTAFLAVVFLARFAIVALAAVADFFAALLAGRFAAAFFGLGLGLGALRLALVAFFFTLLDLLGFAMVASFPGTTL